MVNAAKPERKTNFPFDRFAFGTEFGEHLRESIAEKCTTQVLLGDERCSSDWRYDGGGIDTHDSKRFF